MSKKSFQIESKIWIQFLLAPTLAFSIQVRADEKKSIEYSPRELNKCEALRKRQNTENKNLVYNKVYSTYIEVCASTTWQKRGLAPGGNLGHTFSLIRGACLKRDSQNKVEYPQQLVPCDGGEVSVSTDYIFENTNWVGTEGRDLALYGEHPADQPLDHDAWMKIQNKIYERGFLHPSKIVYKPDIVGNFAENAAKYNLTVDQWAQLMGGDMSAGTDFAIAIARGGVDCTRIPLRGTKPGFEKQPLLDIIEEFNVINREAYARGYKYNPYFNSCVTTSHNALARLGFWPRTNTTPPPDGIVELLKRRADIRAPYNTMFEAFEEGSQFRVMKIVRNLMNNPVIFARFKKSGWLPNQVGTLLDVIPTLEYRNDIYQTSRMEDFLGFLTTLKAFDGPKKFGESFRQKFGFNFLEMKLNPLQKKFSIIKEDEHNPAVKLTENIRVWNVSYKKALQEVLLMQKSYGLFSKDFQKIRSSLKSLAQRFNSQSVSSTNDSDELAPGEINEARRARLGEVLAELKNHIEAKIAETDRMMKLQSDLTPPLNLQPISLEKCVLSSGVSNN